MVDHEIGSGNVFADLGFGPDEAAELAVKSGLIAELTAVIARRGLTQTDAAALLGTDQPTLSKVLRGRMGSLSVERLTGWLTRLGYDVTLTVAPSAATAGERGRFTVEVVG